MRIIVAGGRGFFGRTIIEMLRADGLAPQVGSRGPGADLVLNVEVQASLRSVTRRRCLLVNCLH